MGKQMSLADIKAEADRRYGDLDVDGVRFRSVLRLGADKQERIDKGLQKIQELRQAEAEAGGVGDVAEVRSTVEDVLVTVADSRDRAERMVQDLDLAELMVLLEMWMETTQPGEAQPSPN